MSELEPLPEATTPVPPVPLPHRDVECFVMAPIGEEESETRRRADNVLRHVISPALQPLGLVPVRADEIAEPGEINRQILKHVLTAKASIADLTDANPNVYYELAVRHAAGLPVVLIARTFTRLPFDLQMQRTVFFDETDLDSAARAKEAIASHLSHALTSGSSTSPVLDVADVAILQRAGAEARQVAELIDRVEMLDETARREFRGIEETLRRLPSNPERMHNVRAALQAIRLAEQRAADLVGTGASNEQMAGLVRVLSRARKKAELAIEQLQAPPRTEPES